MLDTYLKERNIECDLLDNVLSFEQIDDLKRTADLFGLTMNKSARVTIPIEPGILLSAKLTNHSINMEMKVESLMYMVIGDDGTEVFDNIDDAMEHKESQSMFDEIAELPND